MDVPGAFLAIDPGERTSQLGDEVIASRLVAIPPAAGDALRTGEQLELGLRDASRTLVEPRRPRSRLHEIVRIPLARRDAPPGVLRPVVRKRRDAIDGVAAQARLQALEELGPLL